MKKSNVNGVFTILEKTQQQIKKEQDDLQKKLIASYKPYDVVSDKNGNVGFIQEVSINQDNATYVVSWMVGDIDKDAWFYEKELTLHCNIFVKIAEASCHPSGDGECQVKGLFNAMNY